MNELLFKIVWCVLVFGALGALVYSICTRGFKGAMFGHKIKHSADNAVKYKHGGMKYTFRIHKFDKDGLYGLEVGQWGAMGGETSAYVIPAGELRLLGEGIIQFLAEQERTGSKPSAPLQCKTED